MLNTSEMALLLGVPSTVSQLKAAGIEPYAMATAAVLWKRSDAAIAAINLADRLIALSEQISKEYTK